jgi:hypothetical protein
LNDGTTAGGNRDLVVTLLAGGGFVRLDSNTLMPGHLTFGSTNARGQGRAQWDGTGNTDGTVDASGLGGLDLLADGAFYFVYEASADHNGSVTIVVHNQGDATPRSVATPFLAADGNFYTYLVPFSAFTALGATLDNVGAIELVIDGETDLDANVEFLGTTTPEPGSWLMLGGGLAALGLMRKRRAS